MPLVREDLLAPIRGLVRIEEYSRERLAERLTELTHTVYPHSKVYGDYCTVHAHIACPPEAVFEYMRNPLSLMEWTYSIRRLRKTARPDVLLGEDSGGTPIYVKTIAHEESLTVDYHCAWDQGDELWMVYLNRIVPAQVVLNEPGSVLIWTNCHHPYYDKNPFPELTHDPARAWVGDWWPIFYAGHTIELENLKAILEHRYARSEPIGPHAELLQEAT